MGKYATDQKFGGQRASIARAVLYATSGVGMRDLCMMFIVGIDDDTDLPIIGSAPDACGCFADYFDAKSEEDLERMPPGSWCWPPRV